MTHTHHVQEPGRLLRVVLDPVAITFPKRVVIDGVLAVSLHLWVFSNFKIDLIKQVKKKKASLFCTVSNPLKFCFAVVT